jgi:hypothetical protein
MEITMTSVKHRIIETNGIRMHVASRARARWSSSVTVFAMAPDMRGYGQTDRPAAIDQYTLFQMIGDMVGLLDALGAEPSRGDSVGGAARKRSKCLHME